jgi:hypothetical protein
VKSVEEGVASMFAEDICKSMRREQSTLESRYVDCVMLERSKGCNFHRTLMRENEKIVEACQALATTTSIYPKLTSSSSFQYYSMSTVNIMASRLPNL